MLSAPLPPPRGARRFFPTAMRLGPDGALYVSNKGYGPPQPGEILRVSVPNTTDDAGADMEP